MLSSVMHWKTRISRRVPFNPDTKRGIGSEAKFNAGHRLCALTISGCQFQHKTRQEDVFRFACLEVNAGSAAHTSQWHWMHGIFAGFARSIALVYVCE
jgi:hypothetical protein